ncbi:hypothetical protein AB6A40_005348 [Gnathostoma spinigerum]|uniref:Protein phosphatase methylesterase-1 n=1 Tax=Gnathostoma spinigerum TaxID=75299 RepID=A0ABD6EKF4_9BILA
MPSQLRRDNDHYTWRIDLTKTEPYWIDWFKGCSQQFLRCHAQKVLILAGADRLDKDLMVAQMQGKFQYTILPKVGHVIQEDSPASMAETLARFVERFKLTRMLFSFRDVWFRKAICHDFEKSLLQVLFRPFTSVFRFVQ